MSSRRSGGRPQIAIESTALSFRPVTGVGHYSREIIGRVIVARPDWDFVLTKLRTEPGVDEWLHHPNVRLRRAPLMTARTYQRFFMRGVRLRYDIATATRPDLWLFPRFVRFPVKRSTPSIAFVYDLSFLVVPECAGERNRRYLTDNVPRTVRQSTRVLTISDHVTDELVQHYGMPSEKAFRIYPAVDLERFVEPAADVVDEVLARHGLQRGYVLSVGTLEPRKNVPQLVMAWVGLPEHVRRQHPLVLVGANGWLNDDLDAQLAPLVQDGSVHRLGYVDGDALPALYAGSGVFAYLSRYEGFGMPVAEALACGAPVVVARNSALLEAGGEVARFVDPHDLDEIRTALLEALDGPRQARSAEVLRHLEQFDWDAGAACLISKIEGLLAS